MGYYVSQENRYYEGDKVDYLDAEVPRRPSPNHVWNGSDWVESSPVPSSVPMRKARRALLQAGLLHTADSIIGSMPGLAGDEARIDWEFSETVERGSNLVANVSVGMGLSESQIDDLFRAADAIQ